MINDAGLKNQHINMHDPGPLNPFFEAAFFWVGGWGGGAVSLRCPRDSTVCNCCDTYPFVVGVVVVILRKVIK